MVTVRNYYRVNGRDYYEYDCLSADTKPVDCGNGSTAFEIDTGKKYYFNEETNLWIDNTAKKLSSIAITTPPTKVEYVVGEEFDSTGAVITATYSDNTTAVVSSSAVWEEKVFSVGDTSVSVSYSYNGFIKTATQSVTVTEEDESD